MRHHCIQIVRRKSAPLGPEVGRRVCARRLPFKQFALIGDEHDLGVRTNHRLEPAHFYRFDTLSDEARWLHMRKSNNYPPLKIQCLYASHHS